MAICKGTDRDPGCGADIVWLQSEYSKPDGKPRWIAFVPRPHPLGVYERKGRHAVLVGVTEDPAVERWLPHVVICSAREVPRRSLEAE